MHEPKLIHRQQGLSLIEQMIAVVIGLLLIAAASSAFLTGSKGNLDTQRMARLKNELTSIATLVDRDIRRAGHWSMASSFNLNRYDTDIKINGGLSNGSSVTIEAVNAADMPFPDNIDGLILRFVDDTSEYSALVGTVTDETGTADHMVHSVSATLQSTFPASTWAAGSWTVARPSTLNPLIEGLETATGSNIFQCILVQYDADQQGPMEFYGFRYNSAEKTIEAWNAASSASTCNNSSNWENISDEDVVEIDNFTLTLVSPATKSVGVLNIAIKEYLISITGHLKNDPSISRTIQQTVRTRNELETL